MRPPSQAPPAVGRQHHARISRPRWVLLFAGWTLFGLAQALMRTAFLGEAREALATLVLFTLPLAWMWAALTPAVGWWTRAVRRRFASRTARIAMHLPALAIAAVLHTVVRRALVTTLGNPLDVGFEVTLLYFADVTVGSYLGAMLAARVLDAGGRLTAREREAHALRERLMAAQMESLDLQLRPHFLFNTLSTIAELAHEAPKTAARILANVIALLESVVTRREQTLASLARELDAVRPYLAIQRLRFSDWLTIEEDVDDDALNALVPQFILQPLVENAVHHGLIGRTERGEIVIRARVSGSRLTLAVVDNGAGLRLPSYHGNRGIGLTNLRGRLEAVYGSDASLTLSSDGGVGTTAILDVPFTDVAAAPSTRGGTESLVDASDDASSTASHAVSEQSAESRSPDIMAWTRSHLAVAVCVLWIIVALLRIQHSYVFMWLRDRFTAEAFQAAIRFDLAAALLWIPLTPVVFWLARVVPVREHRMALRALSHAVFASAIAFYHIALTRLVAVDFRFPLLSGASAEVYAWNVLIYAIMLVVVHFQDIELWIRERELAATRLRQELQEARFRRVTLELRPEVLLGALRQVVRIVQENAARTERILADIGEFLRGTLDGIHDRVVPLRREAANLRSYARVLAVAVAPEVDVRVSISADIMEERVPNGILRAALDSVLGRKPEPNTQVHLDVSPDLGGLVISARTHVAPGASDTLHETRLAALAEYERLGVIQVMDRGAGHVAFRTFVGDGEHDGEAALVQAPRRSSPRVLALS